MIRVSVSDLDLYRSFRGDDEFPLGVFLSQLRRETERTPAMERGHAFAKAMELVSLLGEATSISAEGHTFNFVCDAMIEAWPRREEKREMDYGGVIVTARCDRVLGRVVVDDKTTSRLDLEAYVDRYQWRFYLDMFDADVFRWNIWVCKEVDSPTTWDVTELNTLEQHRYPKLHEDCMALAQEFKEFSNQIGWEGRK